MENQRCIADSSLSLTFQMPDVFKEEVFDRLRTIYEEILEIEQDDSSIKFNKNISFINKIKRGDPLILKAVKCIYIADRILKNKVLSKNEIMKIATEYTRLKNEQMLMQEQSEHVEHILKTAFHIEVFYKAMAAASYYDQFYKGKVIETAFGVYTITAIIEKNEGLRVLYFEPEAEDLCPILSVRGTVADHMGNILDDLHANIGTLSFESGKGDICDLLTLSYQKFPKGCVVLGHSLGGAIAQHIGATFGKYGFISKLYHYNAPGIGFLETNEFIESLEESKSFFDIFDVRHKWDILSRFGGPRLPSTHKIIIEDKIDVTYSVAHEILSLMDKTHEELLEIEVVKAPNEQGFWQGRYRYFSMETLRWAFSPLLRLGVKLLFSYNFWGAKGSVEEVSEETEFITTHKL